MSDADFEIPLDTLILAISQNAILDFFEQEPVAINRYGYIETDPLSFETSVSGVYAGGDVVNDGPSSIVEAAADGKAIARSILGQPASSSEASTANAFDITDLIRRRSQREWRVPVPHTSPRDRENFNEVVLGYDSEQARSEAARCLDCHRYCSICVGVCPNLALQTVCTEPFAAELPRLKYENGKILTSAGPVFRTRQAFQVAVLTDFCNECGNCTSFCPTAGEPYRDKPRLYLSRDEFEAQHDNAFLVSREADSWAMEARWSGHTHRIELDTQLSYTGPWFRARIDPETFAIRQIESTAKDNGASLQPCASMYVLLKGLKESLPHLPVATMAGFENNGRIQHPGYEE